MTVDDFCGEVFFDSQETLNTTDPRFSNCFNELIFDLFPAYYLWLLALPYFFYLHRIPSNNIPVSKLFKAKSILTILLWILAWVDLFRALWEWGRDYSVPAVNLVSPLLLGVSMALALFFIHYERMKGLRNSGCLLIYWLLCILSWIIPLKTKIQMLIEAESLSDGDILRSVTLFLSYILVIINFALACMLDSPPSFIDAKVTSVTAAIGEDNAPLIEKSMTGKKTGPQHEKSPELCSTFLSTISFWWFTRMIILGYKRPLETTDLWQLKKEDEAGYVSDNFLKIWNSESAKFTAKQKMKPTENTAVHDRREDEVLVIQPSHSKQKEKKPSLTWSLCKTFGPYFLLGSMFKLVQDCLTFVNPQLLKLLIQFTKDLTAPIWQGYVLAVGFFLTAFIQSLFLHQYFHVCFVCGMRLRSAIISSIYRKSLLLSNAARKASTVGEVVNLMSVDAQRFMDLMSYVNIIWSGPVQIVLALYFLWNVLGPSVLAGLAVLILLLPVNAVIANKSRALQVKQMKYKDERIKLMNEILNGIKVLKLYAWETSFQKKILAIREKELKVLRSAAYLGAASSFTWVCAPFLVSLATFAVYVLSDDKNVLTAEKAFVSLSLFNIIKFPISVLPMVITSVVQANVSLHRLNKFMNNEELEKDAVDRKKSDGPVIKIENGSFTWQNGEQNVLNDINFEIKDGDLVAVVGQVGCGKSSLISALLGDTEKTDGYVKMRGSVAYVAQQAWIQNDTVRDNIIFGKELDICKYQDVIESCELKTDFDILPGGDMTEIGEKGINLSGGQKQRVSIARAVYQDSQVYLFDDPLSAVDAHVGKNIFEKVIGPGGCLRKKTRILVTHGVAFLPQVDKIIVLKDGKISEVGNYYQLQERDGAFAEFLRNYANNEEEEITEGDPTVLSMSPDAFSINEDDVEFNVNPEENSHNNTRKRIMSNQSRDQSTLISGPYCKYIPLKKKMDENRVCKLPDNKMVEDTLILKEVAETGKVKLSVYASYIRSIGIALCIVICFLYAGQNGVSIASSIWLSEWSNDKVVNGTQENTSLRLGVYGALGISQALLVMFSSFTLSYGAVAAARILHLDMLQQVFRAPMSFFDTTPLGRVINRFSKDIYQCDEVIPRSFQMFLMTAFSTASTFVVIIYGIPIFATVILPVLIFYYFVQKFYVATSRQLKRLESISRSPIYSHFSETVTGASTIRAYGLQQSFIFENERKVDLNQMAYYPNIVSNRWLALRLEFVGNCIVLFAAIFAVAGKGTISAGIVGLSVSYALQITQTLNWMVRQTSELETNIVAVERVKEYSRIVGEADEVIEDNRPPQDWPKDGAIRFENYSTRYRKELDLVVKEIDVDIKGGEKIGIVGRTGAGKSSLTLALFRIIESAGGNICIDNLNISKMGLFDLRSKLSIIPQDPVLFSGTLRMNLDPFDAYTDEKLWDALEHSHLKPFVSSLPQKLEHDIAEGGENLSVGQRQLVCLARALLRRSKILVLDEATAAVDLETDDLIQATIRVEFQECTTFTIAHRLNTIMDSTRVLVLDAGKVAEFDTPTNLLRAKGIFYGMAKDAGLAY